MVDARADTASSLDWVGCGIEPVLDCASPS